MGEVAGIEELIELSIGEEVCPASNVVSTFIYDGPVGVEGERAFVKRRVVEFAFWGRFNERAVRAIYIVAFWRRFAVRGVGGWLSVGIVSIGKRKVYDVAVAVDPKRAQHRPHHSEN